MNGAYDLDEGIRRLQAFEAAGADLLYLPVPPGRAELARVLAIGDEAGERAGGGAAARR